MVLTLNQAEQSFEFLMNENVNAVTPSLLRGFSAPVHLEFNYTNEQLALLLAHDDDEFARWEAGQTLFRRTIAENETALQNGNNPPEHTLLINALRNILNDNNLDAAFKAMLLQVPAEAELWGERDHINPVLVAMAREALLTKSPTLCMANCWQMHSMRVKRKMPTSAVKKLKFINIIRKMQVYALCNTRVFP